VQKTERAMERLYEQQKARNESIKKCEETQKYEQRTLTDKKNHRFEKVRQQQLVQEKEYKNKLSAWR
jgi:hypothetical protein